MKSNKEIRRELLQLGATQRLLELNHERDALLKILERGSKVRKSLVKHLKVTANKAGFKYKKGTHWTQKPENKERLRKILSRVAGRNK